MYNLGPRPDYHPEDHVQLGTHTRLPSWISCTTWVPDQITILNIMYNLGPRPDYHSEDHVQLETKTRLPFWRSCTAWDPDDYWRCTLWWCECRRWQRWCSRLSWLMCSNLNLNVGQSRWRLTASLLTPVDSKMWTSLLFCPRMLVMERQWTAKEKTELEFTL